MFDVLLEPAKIFVEKGLDAYRKTQEHKNLRIAMQDRIRREVRFNVALLNEYINQKKDGEAKHEKEIREGLIKSLRTTAFDDADAGVVPLTLFFEDKIGDDVWPQKGFDSKDKYKGYLKSVQTQYDLLERIYYRIRIAKTFADCGKIYGDMDYVRFMLVAFEKAIAASRVK